jgi:hypothetical protein
MGQMKEPIVRVAAEQGSDNKSAGISIDASDSEGRDSLEITCRAMDLRYHTQLPTPTAKRHFTRTFTLSELFPSAQEWKDSVVIEVTVRNTRGATASNTVVVQTKSLNKGTKQ